jgi:hypothetical protein
MNSAAYKTMIDLVNKRGLEYLFEILDCADSAIVLPRLYRLYRRLGKTEFRRMWNSENFKNLRSELEDSSVF